MKKLLLVFLGVMLVVAFSVPAMATEVATYDFNGHILPLPPGVTDGSIFDYENSRICCMLFTLGSGWYILVSSEFDFTLNYSNSTFTNQSDYTVSYSLMKYSPDDGWLEHTQFDLAPGAVYSNFLADLVWDNYTVPCNGTNCPSTDDNRDNVCDDCGLPFAVERDYSPFTIKKFLSNVGQILTSTVSWVGNVGSTILQQPLLLAFCALPICGIGIGVFRRLRDAN